MSNLYVTQTVNGDLQPVKVNGESSALEIAQDEVKVKILEIDGASKVPTPTANHHIANKKYVDDNAGGGSFSSFTLTGDSGSDQTIEDGNTVDIEGGTGIDTTVGTTDKVSIALASGAALANLSGGSGTTFLKKDGTWATPTDTNTTYTAGDFITLTGTDFDVDVKDEDNMASDSATHLCTQQSIKKYSDAHAPGSIIGYTRLNGDGTNLSTYEIQNSMTVEDSTHQISFNTPQSENVEIELQCFINVASTDTKIHVGLSDNSTYNSIGALFEYDSLAGIWFGDDEIDDITVTIKWVVGASELASIGSSNTFYVGFSTAGVTKTATITYGSRASHGITSPPFILKATTLPSTIYDGT